MVWYGRRRGVQWYGMVDGVVCNGENRRNISDQDHLSHIYHMVLHTSKTGSTGHTYIARTWCVMLRWLRQGASRYRRCLRDQRNTSTVSEQDDPMRRSSCAVKGTQGIHPTNGWAPMQVQPLEKTTTYITYITLWLRVPYRLCGPARAAAVGSVGASAFPFPFAVADVAVSSRPGVRPVDITTRNETGVKRFYSGFENMFW